MNMDVVKESCGYENVGYWGRILIEDRTNKF